MIEYLKESYCNGLPPANVSSSGLFERNALVSRMMLAQGRVKLLCSPSMMGKTSLACQYAKASRSFFGVFWVDAQHPRFLRGLYDGQLGEAIERLALEKGLFVFEDVPQLGDAERRRFCDACRALVSNDIDVVVNCTAAGNPFVGEEDECLVLSSEDLLYSDEELASLRRQGYLPSGFQGIASKAERIPGLLNHPSGSIESFLLAQQSEANGSFQQLLTYALLVLGGGTLEDLSYVMGADVSVGDLKAEQLRPYVGVFDFGTGFSAEGFPLGDVLRMLRGQLPRICGNSPCIEPDDFSCRLANLLLERRSVDRATRVMIEACGPVARLAWIKENAGYMVDSSAPLNVLLLIRSLSPQVVKKEALLGFWEAFAHMLLGEAMAAFHSFERIAKDPTVEMSIRLEAASFAALAFGAHPSMLDFGESFGSACLLMRKQGEGGALSRLWNALLEGDSGIEQLSELAECPGGMAEWILALACCVRGVRFQGDDSSFSTREVKLLDGLLSHAGEVIEGCLACNALEARLLILSRELDALGYGPQLSRAAISLFDQIGARMRVQRSAFSKLAPASGMDKGSATRYGQDLLRYRGSGSSVMSIPLLEVRMFGRFEALIGGKPIAKEHLARMKARSLLAMLALEPGKDYSCERMAMLLWPDSVEAKARRNFYSIFSILKRSLTLEDGSCPYLTRSQGVCRLSAPYVRTDATELLEVCQRMRHGSLSRSDAVVLLERMRGIYRGELLPGERVVYAIEVARRTWRNRVVDSLVAASAQLKEKGDFPTALELASFAFECDPQREDACELVMVMQYSMKQRAGAVETFFSYQKTNRELGLDPSHRMLELYDKIISDDTVEKGEYMLG